MDDDRGGEAGDRPAARPRLPGLARQPPFQSGPDQRQPRQPQPDRARSEAEIAQGVAASASAASNAHFVAAADVDARTSLGPGDRTALHAYPGAEMRAVRAALAAATMTERRFQDTRKIVSRMVAMFDCVDTPEPSPGHRAMVRYLGTINGLMGGMHDDMVACRLRGGRGGARSGGPARPPS